MQHVVVVDLGHPGPVHPDFGAQRESIDHGSVAPEAGSARFRPTKERLQRSLDSCTDISNGRTLPDVLLGENSLKTLGPLIPVAAREFVDQPLLIWCR